MLLPQTTGSISSGTLLALMSLSAKHAILQAMILLPLETRKVACGNTVQNFIIITWNTLVGGEHFHQCTIPVPRAIPAPFHNQ